MCGKSKKCCCGVVHVEKILCIGKYLVSLTLILLIGIQTYYHDAQAAALLPDKGFLLLGWIFTHAAAFALHVPPYRLALKQARPRPEKSVNVDRDIWTVIHFALTPDYFWATYNKNRIAVRTGGSQRSRSEFVEYSNWINFTFAAVIYLVLTVVDPLLFPPQSAASGGVLVLQSFLLIRLLSRCLEMTIAFYRDVATNARNVRNSNLSKYRRISLAVHSYFELIVAYAVSYYVLDFPLNFADKPDFTPGLLDSLYYSLGVVTFTNVNIDGFNNLQQLIVYSQVITAQVLIGLSIASYIGWEDEKDQEE